MPGTPTQVTCNGTLLDDYLYTATAPVAQTLAGRFAVVTKGTGSNATNEIVTVDSTGKLLHLWPDATSQSGWNMDSIAVAPVAPVPELQLDILRLTAFYDGATLNVLAYLSILNSKDGALVWMERTVDSSGKAKWSRLDTASQPEVLPALGVSAATGVYMDAGGNPYVHSVTNTGGGIYSCNLLCRPAGQPLWRLSQAFPALSQTYAVLPGAAGAGLTVLWTMGPSVFFQRAAVNVDTGAFSWSAPMPAKLDIEKGPLAGGSILPLPVIENYAGPACFLLQGEANSDGSSGLYYISGYDQAAPRQILLNPAPDAEQMLQPRGFTSVAAGVDASSNYVILATDRTSQSLWLLRQSGTDSSGAAVFGSWIKLGGTLEAIACPQRMTAGPEAYAVSLDGGPTLMHLAQSLTGDSAEPYGMWYERTIAGPSPSTGAPTNTPTYTNDITFLDETGAQVAVPLVNVTADRPTVLMVDGISYHVDWNTPAQLATGHYARLTVAMPATNLSAPVLTLQVPGTSLRTEIGSDAKMFWRLSGKDPSFPVNAASLTSAGLISTQYASSADQIASAITAAAAQASTFHSTAAGTLGTLPVTHWTLDFSNTPAFQALSDEQATSLMASSSALSKLEGAWNDVCNFFKKAAQTVKKVVVQVVGDALNVVLEIGNWVWQGMMKTVQEISGFLEVVFTKVGAAITTAIHWLKSLFDWGDITNTQKVFANLMNSAISKLITTLDENAINWVNQEFDGWANDVNTFFQNARSSVDALFGGSGASLNSHVDSLPGNSGPNTLAGTAPKSIYTDNSEQCTYVSNKVPSTTPAPAGQPPSTSWSNLLTTIVTELGDDFVAAFEQFKSLLEQQAQDPKGFFNTAIDVLLDALQVVVDFVLKVAKQVICALLQAAADAMATLQDLLNYKIDIPFLSWLFKEKIDAGQDLTLLNLGTLILAVPATIVYKVAFGGKAPFASSSAEMYWPDLPWGKTPAPVQGMLLAAAAPSSSISGSSSGTSIAYNLDFWRTLSLCLGMGGVLFKAAADVGLSIAAWSGDDEGPVGVVVSLFDAFFSFLIQLGSIPYSLIGSQLSVEDGVTWALWIGGFIPIATNLGFTWKTEQGDARFNQTYGYPIMMFMGGFLLLFGIYQSVRQAETKELFYSGWTYAGNVIGPLPLVFTTFLLFKPNPYVGAAYAILMGLADVAACVVSFGSNLPNVPSLTSVTPASGKRGETTTVSLAGSGTAFGSGITAVSFSGSGMAVSNTQASDAEDISFQLAIAADATTGSQQLKVATTGSPVVYGTFTVTA